MSVWDQWRRLMAGDELTFVFGFETFLGRRGTIFAKRLGQNGKISRSDLPISKDSGITTIRITMAGSIAQKQANFLVILEKQAAHPFPKKRSTSSLTPMPSSFQAQRSQQSQEHLSTNFSSAPPKPVTNAFNFPLRLTLASQIRISSILQLSPLQRHLLQQLPRQRRLLPSLLLKFPSHSVSCRLFTTVTHLLAAITDVPNKALFPIRDCVTSVMQSRMAYPSQKIFVPLLIHLYRTIRKIHLIHIGRTVVLFAMSDEGCFFFKIEGS